MYAQLLTFIVASFTLLTLSRLGLVAWQRGRVKNRQPLIRVLVGGLRMDALLIAAFAALPLLLAPWFGENLLAQTLLAGWLLLGWVLMALLELSTPTFVREYDSRPNRLYLVYLKHPREVCTMLWRGYRGVLVAVLFGLGLLVWLGKVLFVQPHWHVEIQTAWVKGLLSLAGAFLAFLAIRGTLKHRPINPSTVAFCGDALVNTLALNSLYSVAYAAYCLKNERCSADVYGTLPDDAIQDCVRQVSQRPLQACGNRPPASRKKRRNVVLIVEESLGAQFVGHLQTAGGRNLTPELDKLAAQAWTFTRAYATGTRSVRGLEALVAGFPPCLSEAVLKLPGAQSRFFTIAQLFKAQGWHTSFVYGGEAHFDNMQGFFLGNGFDALHDRKSFKNPAFVGTWGVSDEDMFGRVHALLQQPGEQPRLILAFSVSNHTPWEYPQGRITPVGAPASLENSVRYADWALGHFFAQAQTAPYWDDTVFLVAADHDARVGGQANIPLKHFHIPALILGGGIQPLRDDRLVSQIDFPVTLLNLAGASGAHPMPGHDLSLPAAGGRAMMQYGDNYGWLQENILTVLSPHQPAQQFRYTAPDVYVPQATDAGHVRCALAHALWPGLMYQTGAYGWPMQNAISP